MTSATLIKTATRLVEYVDTDGTLYRLVDADGTPAEYGRTYTDHDGDEFVLTAEYGTPRPTNPLVAVEFAGCCPAFVDAEHNEYLVPSWHFARVA